MELHTCISTAQTLWFSFPEYKSPLSISKIAQDQSDTPYGVSVVAIPNYGQWEPVQISVGYGKDHFDSVLIPGSGNFQFGEGGELIYLGGTTQTRLGKERRWIEYHPGGFIAC